MQREKKSLGWSSKFHVGGDLNQIFGLLSNYKYIPKKLKKELKSIVIKNKNYKDPKNWRYTTQNENKKHQRKFL